VIEPLQRARELLDRVEESGLGLREYTGLFKLRELDASEREQLHRQLSALDQSQPSPLWAARGVHQARFVLLEQAKLHASEAAESFPFGPLILSFVHEGDLEDTLHELLEHCGHVLGGIFEHCDAFPGAHETETNVRWLLAARSKSGFFFRDREASRGEIMRALELRRRFLDFVVSQQGAPDSALVAAFEQLRSGQPLASPGSLPDVRSEPGSDLSLGYAYSLARPFEQSIQRERYWVRRTAELARAKLRRITRAARLRDPSAAAVRGVHAKHHGLVKATVTVRADLPLQLMQGVFVASRRYDAWLRFSNAADRDQHDDVPDARGVAIKLLDVGDAGDPVLEHALDDGFDTEGMLTQDIVLVSHPTFFVKDARDYAIFRGAIDTRDPLEQLLRVGLFGLRRPRELAIFARSILRVIDHPLAIEYHSMTASLLGPGHAIKYCLYPLGGGQLLPRSAGLPGLRPPDHLREALQSTLDPAAGRMVRLELAAIMPAAAGLPVEDPRHDWERLGGRRIPLATIDIEPQDFRSRERMQLAERMVFTPWHTLQQHRPLGSLNRARLEVYRASAHERHALNGVSPAEPAKTVVDWPAARSIRESDEAGGTRQRRTGGI
jgi:hypothetical protein